MNCDPKLQNIRTTIKGTKENKLYLMNRYKEISPEIFVTQLMFIQKTSLNITLYITTTMRNPQIHIQAKFLKVRGEKSIAT